MISFFGVLQGGFVGTLRILPESAPFSIDPDGTVRVKDSAALDRETTQNFEFQVNLIFQLKGNWLPNETSLFLKCKL